METLKIFANHLAAWGGQGHTQSFCSLIFLISPFRLCGADEKNKKNRYFCLTFINSSVILKPSYFN